MSNTTQTTNKMPFMVTLTVFCLGMCFSVMYSLPYIKAVFYQGMLELTGATNATMGTLMTIYGFGEVLTPALGGVLATRYDYKKIILFSALASVGACLLLAWFPSFAMTFVAWSILVFSTLFMVWGTWFKALRIMATDDMQSRMTGVFYGFCGVGYFVVNSISLWAYEQASVTSAKDGMVAVFYTFAAILAVFAVIAWVLMTKIGVRNPEVIEADKRLAGQKQSVFGGFKEVAKYRSVWYFGITLFCMYSAVICIQYFTPYFTDVMGVTVAFSGFMAIVRQYGMKIIGSPLGGYLAEKSGSISKTIIWAFLGTAVSIGAILVLPDSLRSVGILSGILLFASLLNNIAGGIQYAIPTEAKVPVEHYASAIGLGSAIGFAPDIFQHVLCGYWIDKHGAQGYNYIMIYGVVVSIIGVVALMRFLSEKKAVALTEAAVQA